MKMRNCAIPTYFDIIIILCLVTLSHCQGLSENQATAFTECGGKLTDTNGVITSPNFPNAYPVPIYCRWVIEAPENQVVALYFTQYYMRDGLRVSEYAFFSENVFMDRKDYGILSSDQEHTYLVTNKNTLVLEFSVMETGNIHLRVREFFLDVFGFNITYEIIDKPQKVRNEGCFYHHCSFTGICYAAHNFKSYYCSCFSDFYGTECRYNGSCGPKSKNDLCLNGGTCRFYIGSMVRTCECLPGYEGLRCEKKKETDPSECSINGCSQSCIITDDEEIICTCFGGYHLADNGKICIEEGRTRYLVSFKLYDQNVDLAHLDGGRYKQLKKGVENALIALLKPRLYRVDNLTVDSFESSAIVNFHFFGEKEDNAQIRTVIEDALKKGKIDKYAVNRTYLVFEWQPALSIQGLEVSEKMPVVEGTELNLACIVQGSDAMTLKWLKDGAPINVNTPYRSMWTMLVPKNSKDQYTALLGFDRINLLDSGMFTCQVSDWDSTHNKTIQIDVISVPSPLLEPLTATVNQGDSFVVTCIPQTYGKLGYNWLKNGKILNPSSEPELIEDLYPAGSRLLVHSAKSSVTYTCIITSSAGSTERNSVITVIDKETTPVCIAETYRGIEWSNTAANTIHRQGCPSEYAGVVSRRCIIKKGMGAIWEEPDYSSCLSGKFKNIKTQFDSLTMGYLITDLETLIQELKSYLWDKRLILRLAEGEPVVELLERMLDYREKTKNDIQSVWNVSETFIDIISFLLESPHLIQKQSHFIKLYREIIEFGDVRGSFVKIESFETFEKETFVMEIGHIPYKSNHQIKFPHHIKKSRRKDLNTKGQLSWLSDSIEIELITKEPEKNSNNSLSITAVSFKNFSNYLPEHYITKLGGLDIEYQLLSQPLAISVKNSYGNNEVIEEPELLVKIRMGHLNNKSQSLKNITCGMADLSENKFDFLMDKCQLISTVGNFTTCQCYDTGMYVVLLTSFTNSKASGVHNGFEIIAGIGCGICAFLLCLTFFILLILWKKLKGAITALKLQVCIALLGAYVAFLKGLHESLEREYYSYVMSIIQFFLLAVFSMQLCLGLIVYIEFTNLQSIQYPELKVAAMGWAVPTIVVGATLASQVPEGFLMDSWWLTFGTNFFLAYIIAVIIIIVLQFILFLTVKAEIRHHQKVESPKQKMIENRTKLLHRSLIIAISLILTSVFSILYINYEDDIFKYLFSFSSACLGMIFFLCYTFCSENAYLLCCPKTVNENEDEKEEPKINTDSNSFKSFLKPEIVGEAACYLNKLSDHIDKKKQLDQVQKLKPQVEICREPDWLETGCLLQDKKPQLKVAIVHSPIHDKHNDGKIFDDEVEDSHPISPRKIHWRRLDSMAPAFELEPMYDSPRSNLHGKVLESVTEEDNPISSSRTQLDFLPPPYHDSGINLRKDYSIKTNPMSSYDTQNQDLRTDISALVVPQNEESNNSASSKSNPPSIIKTINHNGRLTSKDSPVLQERIPLVSPIKIDATQSPHSTPDDTHNSNSVADLISREDDFATEMDVPLVLTDNSGRNGFEQVSPSKKSWSMTAV